MKIKGLLLYLFISLTSTIANAQTLKASVESELEKSGSFVLNVLRDEKAKAIYVFRGTAWASYIDYTLEKYDEESMKLIYFKTIYPTEKRKFFQNAWYVNMYLLDGKPYFLFKEHPPKSDDFEYSLIKINDDGTEESRTPIASKAGKVPVITMRGDFPGEQLITTKNAQTPYIFIQTTGGKSKLKIQFTFLNKALEVVDAKQLNVPEVENYIDLNCVMNNETGEMYVGITKSELDDKNPTMSYLYKMDKNGSFSKVPVTLPKTNWLSDIKLFYDEDNIPMIMGVSIFNGFFIEELKNISDINSPEIYPFDEPMKEKPKQGNAYCFIDNVFVQKGKYAATFRSSYQFYFSSKEGSRWVTVHTQYNVTAFDANGTEWSYNLKKPLEKGEEQPFAINLATCYPVADGYNIVVPTFETIKNADERTYHLIAIKDGDGKESEFKGVAKGYGHNFSIEGYYGVCYDDSGNLYMPYQLKGMAKKKIRLFKFMPE